MTVTYGTLTYHPLTQQPPVWTIQAQPHVIAQSVIDRTAPTAAAG